MGIFLGYAMMAHLIFGYAIEKFSTFGYSINTCFEILLGEVGVNEDLLRLSPLEQIPAVIFFWTYEILVFMILLNFLLAIIVDAFSDVKGKIDETQGLPEEVAGIVAESFKSTMNRFKLGFKTHIPHNQIADQLLTWAGPLDEDEEVLEKSLIVGQ